ncbi:MAG: bifunctional UDP-N-acetylglucosamine diphosphorylase/glucosamine-1-phosphate N-acetyltransferase GlmU [Proteobacteria bacterium]|nr:bifunctional UDP-N-acetylglucosamine diphosphorylase/glucosamine-1-phosphate N-acetyltransferase GlmU [Pseudomonadota bacterium]
MSDKPVVLILAAGLGTRMKSHKAKVLHHVAGRPLIVWVVESAREAGAGRVVAILGHQHEEVRAVLDARYGQGVIGVALQTKQKGTGHAVLSALPALEDEPDDRIVVILTGDAPLLRPTRVAELAEACRRTASGMALLSTCPTREVAYGRLVRDDSGMLLRIVEHADATESERAIDEMNAGFYAVRLGHLRSDVASLDADNTQGEFYLTDLAARAAERGGAAVIDAPFEEVSGINDRIDLAEVAAVAQQRINRALMRSGVTIVAPAQTFVDADTGPFGRDVWIGPGVHLRGKTQLADGARIDVGCILIDTSVAENAHIKPHSVLEDAVIGPHAHIGPFAHCRPGTRVDRDAALGNFVETRNTHLMAGARADHHAYLGDASIGANANVGAGTITCNSDGFSEYKTVIESGAFIGSDSQLVAPVTVGRNAYVAAGTTVTRDVPRSSLALSRVKQVDVEGWADRFREAQGKRSKRQEPSG